MFGEVASLLRDGCCFAFAMVDLICDSCTYGTDTSNL